MTRARDLADSADKDITGTLTVDGISSSGDITLADNAKATFGAGSDLQIYHSGADSYIVDAGIGDLYIRASNEIRVQDGNQSNFLYAVEGGDLRLYHNGSEKLATTSTGVDVTGTVTADGLTVDGTSRFNNYIHFGGSISTPSTAAAIYRPADNQLAFSTSNTERLRIDNSGSVFVAKTASNFATAGIEIRPVGAIDVTRSGGSPLHLNRTSTDGDISTFYKNGTQVGAIGTSGGGALYITDGIYGGFGFSTVAAQKLTPCTTSGALLDNVLDLGYNTARFDDIFATNGTIQTSDANEKQQIAALTDAEMTAAKAISALFKTFKWNSAVEAKGNAARTHTGVIAQDVQTAMTAAGLDAGDYAFFISSTWWETQTEVPAVEAVDAVLDEDGNVVTEAVEAVAAYTRTDTYNTAEEAPEGATERTRMGIRYPELLSFIGAATEQRLANIETRLAALESN